jgi:methionyl-tRNA synthetase
LYIGISSIIDKLKQYGMFIVPVGELEDWFANKTIQDATGIWLVDVLQHMENAQFKPGNDEIWKFVRLVNEWISNPKRLGMPT